MSYGGITFKKIMCRMIRTICYQYEKVTSHKIYLGLIIKRCAFCYNFLPIPTYGIYEGLRDKMRPIHF